MIKFQNFIKNPIYLFLIVIVSTLALLILLNYMYDIGYHLGGAIYKSSH